MAGAALFAIAAFVMGCQATPTVVPITTTAPTATTGITGLAPTATPGPTPAFTLTLTKPVPVRVEIVDRSGRLIGARETTDAETAALVRSLTDLDVVISASEPAVVVLGWVDGSCVDVDRVDIDQALTAIDVTIVHIILPPQNPPLACTGIGYQRRVVLTFDEPVIARGLTSTSKEVWPPYAPPVP